MRGFQCITSPGPNNSLQVRFFCSIRAPPFMPGGYFPVGAVGTLHLSGLYSTQAKANEIVVGGALQRVISEDEKPTSIYVGAWVRANDAVIPYLGLEFSDFRLGATYDVNTSALKAASQSRGGIEISLIYVRRPPDSRGLPCPKF